jgi:hypothetical protein
MRKELPMRCVSMMISSSGMPDALDSCVRRKGTARRGRRPAYLPLYPLAGRGRVRGQAIVRSAAARRPAPHPFLLPANGYGIHTSDLPWAIA